MLANPFKEVRGQFPQLERKVYLSSHSLGAVPLATKAQLEHYYSTWAEHGIEAWNGPWWNEMLFFNRTIESILGAEPGTVVPMENVTRGLAVIASCFDFSGARNEIVMSDLEFTTAYPFWRGVEQLGARLKIVESADRMTVPAEKIVQAISAKTLLVFSSHVYFRSGAIQNLKVLAEAAHRHGALLIGDGYQAVGTVPVNVQSLDVDFYVGGSHKWLCGGPGAGFLYVRKNLIPKLEPKFTGWFGLKEPFEYRPLREKPELHAGVMRFLAGTPSIPALYAAHEGIALIEKLSVEKIRKYSQQMTEEIAHRAGDHGFEVRSPKNAGERSGMVCLQRADSKELCDRLLKKNIIVDWRPDCGIRVSPHFYSMQAEVDQFFSLV